MFICSGLPSRRSDLFKHSGLPSWMSDLFKHYADLLKHSYVQALLAVGLICWNIQAYLDGCLICSNITLICWNIHMFRPTQLDVWSAGTLTVQRAASWCLLPWQWWVPCHQKPRQGQGLWLCHQGWLASQHWQWRYRPPFCLLVCSCRNIRSAQKKEYHKTMNFSKLKKRTDKGIVHCRTQIHLPFERNGSEQTRFCIDTL